VKDKIEHGTMRRVTDNDMPRPLPLEALVDADGQPSSATVISLPRHGLISRAKLLEIYAEDLVVLADEVRRAAYQEGLDQARFEVMESARRNEEKQRDADVQAETALSDKLQELDRVIGALQSQRMIVLHEAEGALIELVFGCLTQMLTRMALDDSLIRGLVSKALEELSMDDALTIRLSISDHAALSESGWLGRPPVEGKSIRWVPDAMLRAGDCMIDTARGTLDSGLDTKISALRDILVSAHKHSKNEHANQL
jgi:flagellar assembly protein FliH